MTGQQDKSSAPAAAGPIGAARATDTVVAAFGGIRPMAQKIGIPVTTVQGWKKRGHIPEPRHAAIRNAAGEHKIDLDGETLAMTAVEGGTAAPPPSASRAAPAEKQPSSTEPSAKKAKPAGQPAPVRQVGGGRLAALALGLALVALAGSVTAPYWTVPLYRAIGLRLPGATGGVATVESPAIGALRDRLNEIEGSVDALAARAGDETQTETLFARIDGTEARLAVIEQIATPVLLDRLTAIDGALEALAADVARLEGVVGNQRVGLGEARTALTGIEASVADISTALEAAIDAQARDSRRIDRLVASDSAAQAFVLAIGQLRAAIDAGRPYDQPLAALSGLSSGDSDSLDDLSALAAMAGSGIPTREALKADFQAMAAAAREADRLSGSEGWVDDALAQVRGLVSVRPAPGEVAGDDTLALLARAEGRLEAGDLNGAIAEVERLEGAADEAARTWLSAATARIEAESAVARLYDLAIARLAQSSVVPSR